MKNSTKIIVSFLSIIAAIVIILLPFIVEKIYYLEPPCDFFLLGYDATDILAYYGSVLSLVGATILGVLTLIQNKKAQEKSDEVNRLQLELQRKSMAMAEAQYSKEQNHNQLIPKFEISLSGYGGNYTNLSLSIKNVASIIISCLTRNRALLYSVSILLTAKLMRLIELNTMNLSSSRKVITQQYPHLGTRPICFGLWQGITRALTEVMTPCTIG